MRWCEAGHAPDAFWTSTFRIVLAAVRGYHRRRGWMAWHVALLGRIDGASLPSLDVMMGAVPRQAVPQTPEQLVHNVRLLKAALIGSR